MSGEIKLSCEWTSFIYNGGRRQSGGGKKTKVKKRKGSGESIAGVRETDGVRE